jgi:hypothetical protein
MITTKRTALLFALVTAFAAAGCSKKPDPAATTTAPAATVPVVVPTIVHLPDAAAPKPNLARPAWCACPTLQTRQPAGGCFKSAACTAAGVQGWLCQADGKTCACGPQLSGCQ